MLIVDAFSFSMRSSLSRIDDDITSFPVDLTFSRNESMSMSARKKHRHVRALANSGTEAN
jgi:hypothetical protein